MIAVAYIARSVSQSPCRASGRIDVEEKIAIWQIREAPVRVIIPSMLRRARKVLAGRLRYARAVVAVLAALFAGVAGFNHSAHAASYDSDELQFLQLIND